jgi:hypothetical protein
LTRHRDAGAGIRRAQVVASRARAAFSGSRRGDGNTGVSGSVPQGALLFLVKSSLAVPQPCRSAAERADNVRQEDHPFLVYADLKPVLQFHHGAGLATSSPSEERQPGLLLALFTGVRGREILRRPHTGSRINTVPGRGTTPGLRSGASARAQHGHSVDKDSSRWMAARPGQRAATEPAPLAGLPPRARAAASVSRLW